MPNPLIPAQLAFSDAGVPWSDQYGDVYHSAAGAAEQTQHVFLHGNGLPARWTGCESFAILETGFGLGLNFLQTWQAWRAAGNTTGRLHFISLEKHPFHAKDILAAHANAGAPKALSEALAAQWPELVPGMHRLEFDDGRVVLTLGLGDAEELLPTITAQVDAIYLDGFSPAQNPDMWSPKIFSALASLSSDHTTLATWSVAAKVREGLTHEGFIVEKAPGFGGKREMLQARFRVPRAARITVPTNKRALVVGAGLAGTGIAERLSARGWDVHILEAQSAFAQGASGNLAGAFRPLPSKDDNRIARITRAGFLYGLRHLHHLQELGREVLWDPCGVLHLARNAEQEARQKEVVAAMRLPESFLRWVTAAEATLIAGHTATFGGWWFPTGGWIQPASLCDANIGTTPSITLSTSTNVARIERQDGQWSVFDADDRLIDKAPVLILANAHDATRLAHAKWLPLQAVRGQVSHLPMAQLAPLRVVVCGQGYITPGVGGHAALGASFVTDDFDLALREDEHLENLRKLDLMLPGYSGSVDGSGLSGRVSLRPVSLDRLPMVGAMPHALDGAGYKLANLPREEGLWLISGFGARGLVWSSLCSELLASRICGEPLPIERDLADAMDPARFVLSPPKPQRMQDE